MPAKKSSRPGIQSILLVDDNANGLKARKMVLEELGCKIVTAIHGRDALEQFAPDTFDLVVTDYKMPYMDGIELIAALRKREPALRIVLISGFADTLGLNEENTDADVVIQKSANEVAHLVRAVTRLMRPKPAPKPARGVSAPLKAKRKTV
jgi:two-component system capsular synthesis sensor histidine kinase RcsC